METMTPTNKLREDLVLFANDLPEYHRLPEGKAVINAFYASSWGDYDLPESMHMAHEMGGLPSDECTRLLELMTDYWTARNQ